MAVISKDLGAVTAYAAAVNRGYTGTKEEFETLMASYATVAEQAAQSAGNASQSATDASQSAQTAETAKGTAQQAATDAQTAQASAQGYAQSAQQSAQSASQSATDAEAAKQTAVDVVDGFASGAQQALESVNSAGINWKSLAQAKALDSEAWAVGTRDGEDVGSSDPAYHNNAKYYAESVGTSAQTATEAAQTATAKASEAQASASAAAESARTLTIDNTLTQSGQAADAKKTGDEITSLKEDLSQLEDVTVTEVGKTSITNIRSNLAWEDGNMNLSGGVGTGTDRRHSNKIEVSEGDVIAYQNSNFLFNYVTAFNGETAVPDKGVINVNSYTVPSGVSHLVLSEYVSRGNAAILHTATIYSIKNIYEDDITKINTALDETNAWTVSVEPSVTWTTGKYMGNNGVIGTMSGVNYSSSIPVSKGDVLFYQNDNYKFRFVCAYNDAGFAVADKGSALDTKFFVVPEGIASVIVTVYDATINSEASLLHITSQSERKAKVPLFGSGSNIARADTMTDESTLTLPGNNCKIGSRYQFSCKVSEFGSVEFAMGTTHVVVDETNIIFKNGTTTQVTVPHGLTIGTEFLLVLQNETSIRPSYVSVSSLGNRFEYNGSPNITFLLDSGIPTIKCVEGTLTNCAFSFTSSHIFKPVWIFGDSYLSWYDTRWTYYAAEDGNTDNVFFSGYAGQNSQSALAALGNELELATPKILVWCLGMNDPDSEDTVNAGWDMVYNQIKEICDYKNIELVLYTAPTTPTMNNRQKNAIVRASGYRYVDVDGLLRINDSGNWIDGALAGDNVHPTALGAKIIYQKFLSDLPEIMTK